MNLKKLLILLFFVILIPTFCLAQTSGNPIAGNLSGGSVSLTNPLGNVSSPQILIGRVINGILSVVGSLALLMFIYGGLLWMTSAGNDQKIKQGREILIWATAGLALVFFSYVLVRFVIQGLTGQEINTSQINTNDSAQQGFNYQTGRQ